MTIVYGTTHCPYCEMVKRFLSAQNVEFNFINLDEEPSLIKEALEVSGSMSVPITKTNNGVVVGWQPKKIMEIL